MTDCFGFLGALVVCGYTAWVGGSWFFLVLSPDLWACRVLWEMPLSPLALLPGRWIRRCCGRLALCVLVGFLGSKLEVEFGLRSVHHTCERGRLRKDLTVTQNWGQGQRTLSPHGAVKQDLPVGTSQLQPNVCSLIPGL